MADHLATATQTRYPWKAVARTILATLVGLAASWGLIIEAAGLNAGIEWVASSIAIAGAVTRLMAVPAVNDALTRIGLGATPKGGATGL